MTAEQAKKELQEGRAFLGIEFGSTRIKAVAIGSDFTPIVQGGHEWENRYEGGYWTYSLEDIWDGLQDCYRKMAEEAKRVYGVTVTSFKAMGFSAMMHGYMAFDKAGELQVPFRTWRNGTTGEAAKKLIPLFDYNIPERWTIAHIYQAMLNKEEHVSRLDYVTTLAGYIHWRLTGERVLGIGDASGVFPIDSETGDYDQSMVDKFDTLVKKDGLSWKLREILPEVKSAGEGAGVLTEEGAALLDPTKTLKAGIPVCPPEGDAGTGMVATNSVKKRTGNVSAGTSIFGMIVLERALSRVYPEIDMVTTPDGAPVAMVHANNCTSDINAWAGLFKEFAEALGVPADMNTIFPLLYGKALEGEPDCGGLLSYGYLSGEFLTHCEEGRPLFVRTPESRFTLGNFMRTHLYSALGALKMGMEILEGEQVGVDEILGHGGFFKTKGVGQKLLAAAMNTEISVMETAGEGGAWGIALLAAYLTEKKDGETLGAFLDSRVFASMEKEKMGPDPEDVKGFAVFMEHYKEGLAIEQAAIKSIS